MGPDFTPEWIWGNDAETAVFAQVYGADLTTIFSFSLDKDKPDTSLANRICSSFHALEVVDAAASFPSSTSMRQTLWEAVGLVWPLCLGDPEIYRMDSVVEIESIDSSSKRLAWKVYNHPLFPRFVQRLVDENCGLLDTPSNICSREADS